MRRATARCEEVSSDEESSFGPETQALDGSLTAHSVAVVATALTPTLMPGIPVLVAALVAVVVGWTNVFAPQPGPTPPDDAPGHGATP